MIRRGLVANLLVFVIPFGVTSGAHKATKPAVPPPEKFVIGRDSFFDFGPPFHYYEVISVQPENAGSRIDRVLVTPPSGACGAPAQVEIASAFIAESVSELMSGGNACAIPEKASRKELKRCKHCLVFSGMNVTIRVQCSAVERQVRMEILDRNIYGGVPTPEHTSWTANLLRRLDQALGPGVPEKPAFTLDAPSIPTNLPQESNLVNDIAAGKFDTLFEKADDKLSNLLFQARHPPPSSRVELASTEPIRPIVFGLPKYPPLAKAARVGGKVRIAGRVDTDGKLGELRVIGGHPLLQSSVKAAAELWEYPKESGGTDVQVTIDFQLNCELSKK